MKKLTSLVSLLFLSFTVFLLTVNESKAENVWWNSSWSRKAPINISVSSGSTEAGYQVLLNVTYDSDMQPDFDDLRFVNGSENAELPYWIESKVDSSYANVWVKVDQPITTSGYTIYMYYGNPDVTSASDGNSTFIEFFNGNHASSFTCSGATITNSNGELHFERTTGGQCYVDITTPDVFAIEFREKSLDTAAANDVVYNAFSDYTGGDNPALNRMVQVEIMGYNNQDKIGYYDNTTYETLGSGLSKGTYYKIKVIYSENTQTFNISTYYDNNTLIAETNDNNYGYNEGTVSDMNRLVFANNAVSSDADGYITYMFFRKYHDPEPTYTIGLEQSPILGGAIIVPDNKPTIQEAINVAKPGDIIFVKPGVYNENIVVNKGVVLQGHNAEINGDIDGDNVPDGNCITINSDNVVISGFVIHNCYNGITGETSNSVIKDNIIYDSFNYPGSAGVGILLFGENNNNIIKNNEIFNNDRQGIFIGHCDFAGDNGECTHGDSKISRGNVISYNKIYNNGLYRISNGPDESEYGIQLWGGDKNYIENNEIYGQNDWSFGQGIYLFDSNDNVIRDNDIYFNRNGISQRHDYRAVGNNHINFNNIYNNIDYGVRNFDSPITLDAKNNWWGDETGPYHAILNPNGLGNKVSDNVDFDSWLNHIATMERKLERVDFLWNNLQIKGKWLWQWLLIDEGEGKWIWDKVIWMQGKIAEFDNIFFWMRQWNGFADFWKWFDMPECPYECCVDDGMHKNKLCSEGFVCIENECIKHICDNGEKQCVGDELQECQNNQWTTIETCIWGCAPENAHCNPRMSGWQCYRECKYNHNYIQACFDTYTWMKYFKKYCPRVA